MCNISYRSYQCVLLEPAITINFAKFLPHESGLVPVPFTSMSTVHRISHNMVGASCNDS